MEHDAEHDQVDADYTPTDPARQNDQGFSIPHCPVQRPGKISIERPHHRWLTNRNFPPWRISNVSRSSA
jgi:hypothetical protein